MNNYTTLYEYQFLRLGGRHVHLSLYLPLKLVYLLTACLLHSCTSWCLKILNSCIFHDAAFTVCKLQFSHLFVLSYIQYSFLHPPPPLLFFYLIICLLLPSLLPLSPHQLLLLCADIVFSALYTRHPPIFTHACAHAVNTHTCKFLIICQCADR